MHILVETFTFFVELVWSICVDDKPDIKYVSYIILYFAHVKVTSCLQIKDEETGDTDGEVDETVLPEIESDDQPYASACMSQNHM